MDLILLYSDFIPTDELPDIVSNLIYPYSKIFDIYTQTKSLKYSKKLEEFCDFLKRRGLINFTKRMTKTDGYRLDVRVK